MNVNAFGGASGAPKRRLNIVRVILMNKFDHTAHDVEAIYVPFISEPLMELSSTNIFAQHLLHDEKFIADMTTILGLNSEDAI